MIIQSDSLLTLILTFLSLTVIIEYFYSIWTADRDEDENKSSSVPVRKFFRRSVPAVIMSPPVHQGSLRRDRYMEDFLVGGCFVPNHCRRLRLNRCQKHNLDASRIKESSVPVSVPTSHRNDDKKRLSLLPKLPNCEPDGLIAQEMRRLFPNSNIVDIFRFLVARKGNIEQAAAMMRSAVDWHSSNFPSRNMEIVTAFKTGCFFYHGKALDGTPILFFRGAFYDSKVASPLQYVLAAAYVIDTVMSRSDQISVTVLVHACGIKGAPNESADINFIKTFVQILSDNYPERLKRLVIYPFPWFGRALWSIIKMFIDKRTQDKVVLLPGNEHLPLLLKSITLQLIFLRNSHTNLISTRTIIIFRAKFNMSSRSLEIC